MRKIFPIVLLFFLLCVNKCIGQSIKKISLQYHKGSYWKKNNYSELLVITPSENYIGKFEHYKISKIIDNRNSTKDTTVFITDTTKKIKYNRIDTSIINKLYIELTDSTKEYKSRKDFEWIFENLTKKRINTFVPQEGFGKRYGNYYHHVSPPKIPTV